MRKAFESAFDSLSQASQRRANENFDNFKNANWENVLLDLGRNGSDLEKNRTCPTGDGDQSPLRGSKAQKHRSVWSAGGNIFELLRRDDLPAFVTGCILGSIDMCRDFLTCVAMCTPEDKLSTLETRHSILRLPPLFCVLIGYVRLQSALVAAGKEGMGKQREFLDIMKLLLKHGARCDARDLCGKTLIHYAIGPLCKQGDNTLLEMAALCIERAKELGLPPLVNAQDRFGGVPLQEAIKSNRPDLVQFLCITHGADASIKDFEGVSAESMSRLSPECTAIISLGRRRAQYHEAQNRCVFLFSHI